MRSPVSTVTGFEIFFLKSTAEKFGIVIYFVYLCINKTKTNRIMEATPLLIFIGLILLILNIVFMANMYNNIKNAKIATEDIRTILLEFYKKQKDTKK